METRKKEAIERHDKGYNCAQAVACTYCDLVGMDEKTIFRAMEGFGLGMGSTMATCGAISGAVALAGLMNSTGNLEKPNSKKDTYQLARQIVEAFKKKNNSITCRELKGIDTGKILRPCPGCIEDACDIVEEILFSTK